MSTGAPAAEPALEPRSALAERRQRHDYDRLLMLSDGVFAIAITLAALEIRPPEHAPADTRALLNALLPGLITYAISFAVIAAYWSGHRRMFATLVRVDGRLIAFNLLFLGLVALQPAAVALLTRLGPFGGALPIYYGMVVAIGVSQALFWGYAAFVARLVDPALGFAYRLSQLVMNLVLPIAGVVIAVEASRTRSPLFLGLGFAFIFSLVMARRLLTRRLAS
jgi:uncharacterized membrane protein